MKNYNEKRFCLANRTVCRKKAYTQICKSLFFMLCFYRVFAASWNPVNTDIKQLKGGILDFSFMNKEPAGASGFIRKTPEGDLFFEKTPGVQVRFNGINLGHEMSFPPKKLAGQIADFLLSLGYNIVRIHSYDGFSSFSPHCLYKIEDRKKIIMDPEMIDRFDFFSSELKKRGIYIVTDLYVGMRYDQLSVMDEWLNNDWRPERKYLIYFTETGFNIWKETARLFLTHVNFYTGHAPLNDPQYISISTVNEDTITSLKTTGPLGSYRPSDAVLDIVLKEFNSYIKKKFQAAPLEKIYNNMWEAEAPYGDYILDFYTEKTVSHYRERHEFLRKLGYRGFFGGLNFINSPVINYWRSRVCDVFETHLYYSPRLKGLPPGKLYNAEKKESDVTGYEYPAKFHKRLTEIFKDENPEIQNYFPSLSCLQNLGQPFFLTEYNTRFPFPGREETGIITAAVAAYAGWDNINRFTLTGPYPEMLFKNTAPADDQLSVASDAPSLLSEYAASLLFRRNYIKQAPVKFVMMRDQNYSGSRRDSAYARTPLNPVNGDYRSSMGYIPHLFNVQTVYCTYPDLFGIHFINSPEDLKSVLSGKQPAGRRLDIPENAGLKDMAEVFIKAQKDEAVKKLQLEALAHNTLVSDTGELAFDLASATYTVNTPKAGAICGGMNDKKFSFPCWSFQSGILKASFLLIALDEKVLAESARILIFFITDIKGTGEKSEEKEGTVVFSKGALPALALEAAADFTLVSKNTEKMKFYKTDLTGKRTGEIQLKKNAGNVSARIDTKNGFVFELSAE